MNHAVYVRRNPVFDREARDVTLALADAVRAFLESVEAGEPPGQALDRLLEMVRTVFPHAANDPHLRSWTQIWASSGGDSARHAAAAFLDPRVEARARFHSFATMVENAGLSGAIREALWLGSLLNFGAAPALLPVIDETFRDLEEFAGLDPEAASGSLGEQYEAHLAFAAELERELVARGADIRDMLDVQSIISFGYDFRAPQFRRDFWTSTPPEGPLTKPGNAGDGSRSPGDRPYLSVCGCLGFEAPYILEWIEFHRLVGVERFFLYNNGDREIQKKLLEPYVAEGIVVLHDWPVTPPQIQAYNHCLSEHREDSEWIAFVDVDEFLFSPTGGLLPELLVDYEGFPGIGVNLVAFGPSGHRTMPPGLVTENYLRRRAGPAGRRAFKSVVDPRRAVGCNHPHWFQYDSGNAVDENRYPIVNEAFRLTFPSTSLLRINHYFTKSHAEFKKKVTSPTADAWIIRRFRPEQHDERFFEYDRLGEVDETILMYLPHLQSAVEAAGRGKPLAAPTRSQK